MVGPTPSGQPARGRRPDRRHRAELAAGPARRSAPTWRIDSPTSTRHSGRCFGLVEVGEQLLAVGRQHPAVDRRSASVFLAARVNSGGAQQLGLVEVEQVALVRDHRRRRAARPPPPSRAPRCRTHRARPGGRSARAAGPGRCGGWGSGCPCRPPSPAPASVPHAGHRSASRHALGAARAARRPARRSRGSRRRPCAGPPCRRSARPCARPRRRCAGSPARPSSRPPAPAPSRRTASPGPVRPTLTWMSRSLALTSSGGYL